MRAFSKRIQTKEGFHPSFFFTKIYTIQGVRFHVSVIDKDNRAHAFYMELIHLEWKITNAARLPDWIIDVENELQEIIFGSMTD